MKEVRTCPAARVKTIIIAMNENGEVREGDREG